MNQTTIFDFVEDNKYKITKPIRLIELFSGYGSQALALKYLNVPFEHWKTCEWAVKSIQAYKDIHFTNDDIEILMTKEEMVEFLFNKGISSNYNEPMTRKQIERLGIDKLETIVKNILITKNMVNIQQVKGEDLDIKDTDKFTYLLTYSFPCQDLSLAGKGKGMHDTSTRSGMLWEVERILTECKEIGNLPEVLLMENVTQVHGKKNIADFQKWQDRLKELGYTNYWQDLIATDYGIPQTRNRTFMVSILGNYNYTFPKPMPLEKKLKDLLEDNVDEKYYLSEKLIKCLMSEKKYGNYVRKHQFLNNINRDVATVLTAASQVRPSDTFIVKDTENYIEWKEYGKLDIDCRASKEDKVSSTIVTTPKNKVLQNNLRIRKLTPKECFRLQGVRDEDIDNVMKNQSNASGYHLPGDSIVVNVLMAIFKEML